MRSRRGRNVTERRLRVTRRAWHSRFARGARAKMGRMRAVDRGFRMEAGIARCARTVARGARESAAGLAVTGRAARRSGRRERQPSRLRDDAIVTSPACVGIAGREHRSVTSLAEEVAVARGRPRIEERAIVRTGTCARPSGRGPPLEERTLIGAHELHVVRPRQRGRERTFDDGAAGGDAADGGWVVVGPPSAGGRRTCVTTRALCTEQIRNAVPIRRRLVTLVPGIRAADERNCCE